MDRLAGEGVTAMGGYLPEDCLNHSDSPCAGPVELYSSLTGASTWPRCTKHYDAYLADTQPRLDAVTADWGQDSPLPQAWFDPAYAGERWDCDY